jgi:hypothetical protein
MQLSIALGRLWIALGLFAVFAAGAAVIYKWTDADGVIHYSDQAVPGAERIVTSSGSANGVGSPRAPANSIPNKAPPTGLDYNVFALESPAKDQVFFGDEIVPVRLGLAPALKPNQAIAWHLNGAQLTDQSPDAVAFALQGLPRGSYVIAATVTDAVSGESQTTDSVTFYVRQPSELAPQHRNP